MISKLTVGQRLTIFWIAVRLKLTRRRCIQVRSVLMPVPAEFGLAVRLGTCSNRGSYSEYDFDLPHAALVFRGWRVPFRADTEAGAKVSANACYNLVGQPAVIRDRIETKQLNTDVGDLVKAKVLIWPAEHSNVAIQPSILYPEIKSDNQAINQLKEALSGQDCESATAHQFESGVCMLTVILSSAGNPDLRQDPSRPLPGVPIVKKKIKDLATASDACLAYIARYELGGGNWNGGEVFDSDGNKVASVSYNGVVWPPQEWTADTEPLYRPEAHAAARMRRRRR